MRKKEKRTVSGHPSYQNPTVAEALCEIHFEYPTERSWRETRYGELLKALQPDFPTMESRMELGFPSSDPTASQIPIRPRNLYRHKSRPLVCQLREGVFTINELPAYPGWKAMLDDVLGLWRLAASVVKPTAIIRVGLRYINRMPKSADDDTSGEWLRPTEFIPDSIRHSGPGFYSRVKKVISDFDRVTVTVTDAPAELTESFGDVVLDIDRIAEKPVSRSGLQEQLVVLHEDVWSVFDAALTPRLQSHLNQRRNHEQSSDCRERSNLG